MNEGGAMGGIRGREVCITGRLASMPRAEAMRRLQAADARFTALPTPSTSLVLVGAGGPPLDDRGRPTRALRRAHLLHAHGVPIRIVAEEEGLGLLGFDAPDRELERLYTTQQLSRILEIPPPVLRTWMRAGLVRPERTAGRLAFFSFREVATARALLRLTRAGVTTRRLRRSLELLRTWWPGQDGLRQLDLLEDRGPLMVRLADGRWAEPSGQLHLGFDGRDVREPAPVVSRHAAAPTPTAPEVPRDWFGAGVEAEAQGDLEGAVRAYRQALLSGGPQPETSFNLGNCFYALSRLEEAATSFSRAVNIDPHYVEAWNNLGNALGDLGRIEDALRAYRRALAVAPEYADAHYNIAETLAMAGHVGAARRHWQEYLSRDPRSSWANRVRTRLRDTGGHLEDTPG